MADDLTTLSELDENTLLEQIKQRYNQEKIYTYIGDILVAVNPYKKVPLYGSEKWTLYTDVKTRRDHPPHIYVISDCTYQNMRRNGVNQCCVVSGESGAGKTESTKLLIEHIAQLCRHDSSNLHDQIVQVNPLLEAFGNAQTVINNNSSRFGKFIELMFDNAGQIQGAQISEYLLEKSRVVSHSEGEKNFHIFYYLFAGLDADQLKANLLTKPENHRIMKQSNGHSIYADKAAFEEAKTMWKTVLGIMEFIGFTSEEVQGIQAVLGAILHISDIKFLPDPATDGVSIQNDDAITLTAQLLAVPGEDLVDALILTTSTAGSEKITSLKNESQANDGRDALAKALYGRMFSWIVGRINNLLKPKQNQSKKQQSDNWIGILDIYGFENFQHNSFEQLCINVANEQLQLFFNQHIFKYELDEYEKEGIAGSNIVFVDNRPLMDLFLEAKDPPGLFALLDEESKFPQASDQTLIDKLVNNLGKKQPDLFQTPRGQGLQFMIKHFAGSVTYNVTGFLEKNRDTLSDNVTTCLKKSDCLLVYELFSPLSDVGQLNVSATVRMKKNYRMSKMMVPGMMRTAPVNSANQLKRASIMVKPGGGKMSLPKAGFGTIREDGSSKSSKTLACHFKNSLCDLLEKMLAAQPHFIRCIKPNAEKEPNNFQNNLVMQQLSYTGVLETVKIRRQGFSTRLPFPEFIQRFGLIAGAIKSKGNEEDKKLSRQVMEQTSLQDWQLGKTKVFLKYWHVEKLNILMLDASKQIISCQKFWRGASARLKYQKLLKLAEDFKKQMETFAAMLAKSAEAIYLSQANLKKEDEINYAKKIEEERLEKDRLQKEKEWQQKEQEEKERKRIEEEQQFQARILAESSNQVEKRSKKSPKDTMVPTALKERMPAAQIFPIQEEPSGKQPEQARQTPQPTSPPPQLPGPYRVDPHHSINDTTQFLLHESLCRVPDLSTDIWSKLYFMEKNAIIGKVYIRDWEVVIDDSSQPYNGSIIGVNSEAFEHIDDKESRNVVQLIGKGVMVSRDQVGNIYLTKLTENEVHIKGYHEPDKYCFPPDIGNTGGKLRYEKIKIFDMAVFKKKVAEEIVKPNFDAFNLTRLCVIGFSFVAGALRDTDLPVWVTILNFSALDLLGKDNVFSELKAFKKDIKKEEKKWKSLDFKRRQSTFGNSAHQ